MNPTETINTWEDVCAFHKMSTDALPDVSKLSPEDGEVVIADFKLKKSIDAINDGHVFDWTIWDEKKYYPWWDMSSGSGLSYGGYDYTAAHAHVGSRLCYVSKEKMLHGVKVLFELYKTVLTVPSKK